MSFWNGKLARSNCLRDFNGACARWSNVIGSLGLPALIFWIVDQFEQWPSSQPPGARPPASDRCVDVHWHALRQAHPSKDGIHRGEPSQVRLRVWGVDARGGSVGLASVRASSDCKERRRGIQGRFCEPAYGDPALSVNATGLGNTCFGKGVTARHCRANICRGTRPRPTPKSCAAVSEPVIATELRNYHASVST